MRNNVLARTPFVRLTLLGLIVSGAGGLAAPPTAPATNHDRHVVIISVDGFAAYLLDDPKVPIPNIRKLAREGAVVAGGMKVSNPSVTWPNHTSLVTGVHPDKHGVLVNGVLVRSGVGIPVVVNPRKDQQDLVRVPTLFDAAKAAGLSTAEVNWPCTRGARSLDDSFPDVPDAVRHSTPRLRQELVQLGFLLDETDKSFTANSVVGRDYIWTEAACHIIRKRRPNLLLLHLLNVDATHHAEGAQSPPGYTANAYADMCIGRVLEALEEADIREKSTIFVVADHGFTLTPKAIRPNVILRQKGLLQSGAGGKISEAQIHVIPEGGIGLVYCTDPGTVENDRKCFQELFSGQEGVAEILTPEQFAEHGMPHPREYTQAPDLVLVAKDGYAVSGSAEGETLITTQVEGSISIGSHAFLSTLPKMNAICVISGAAIRSGSRIDKAENIDVMPTAARLLGLKTIQVDGQALEDALK
jgi:predicted AlkP superfamily pyrophosphatase or phosphodiesterase